MSARVHIPPRMITWAIDRAGYVVDEFAEMHPRVLQWLEEKKQPTVKQLEAFSNKVHLPFGYLFLPEPPVEQMPIPFFRTGRAKAAKVSLNVQETVRILKYRQDWLADYLQENEADTLEFVGKFGLHNSPEAIAADMRATLDIEPNWASRFPTWREAKAYLTQKIEDTGIVVVFNSIVENNTRRKIDVQECRGFVLVDPYAPFLFVNSADSKAAQMFTLAHELAHVWTGTSAGFDSLQMLPADDPMEQLCDKVAAEFLVPADAFMQFWSGKPGIEPAARHFKVSPIVAGRRAMDLRLIGRDEFFRFYQEYTSRDFVKKDKNAGGGDFYATQKVRLGLPFISRVYQALRSGAILHRDAYQLTGLKGDTFQQLVKRKL